MRAYKWMLAAALISLPIAAKADGMPGVVVQDDTVYSRMTYSGLDFSKNSWDSTSGAIFALNRDMSRDGVMLRFQGAYGQYDYDTAPTRDVDLWQGDVMIGYQWVRDRVEFALYAGVDVIDHDISPDDTSNPVRGTKTGFKTAGYIESRTTDVNLPYYFLLDGAYSTAFDTYYALGRLGLNRNGTIFGVEGWLLGDEDWDAQRLGGFVQFERNLRSDLMAQLTLSAGYQFADSGASCTGRCGSDSEGAYATVNLSLFFGDHRRREPLK
jgi:Cellulose biosynthesis protein BcsS